MFLTSKSSTGTSEPKKRAQATPYPSNPGILEIASLDTRKMMPKDFVFRKLQFCRQDPLVYFFHPNQFLQRRLRGVQMEIPFWSKMEATQNLRSIWISPTFPLICSNYVLHQNKQLPNPTKKTKKKKQPLLNHQKKKMTEKKNSTDFVEQPWNFRMSIFCHLFCHQKKRLQDCGGDRPTWRHWIFPWIRMFPKIGVPLNHPLFLGFSIIFTIHFGVPPIFGNTHKGINDAMVTWEWLMIVHERIQDTENNSYGPYLHIMWALHLQPATRFMCLFVAICLWRGGNWMSDFWVYRNPMLSI